MEYHSLLGVLCGFLLEEVPPPEPSIERANGEIPEWKKVLEKIIDELKKSPYLMEQLESSFDDTIPFLSYLLSNPTVKKMIGEYIAQCKKQIEVGKSGKKNAAKAASIRLLGNSLFVKKEYRAAFKMYTRALMFAKDEDDETPQLYADRSDVYFHLEQYENALEDIERALKFGYGNVEPIGKLLIRKGFSLLALGRDDQVKELLDANLPACEDGPEFAQWQQLKKESENVNRQSIKRDITLSQFQDVSTVSKALASEEIFHPHGRFPWLNAKIDLRYDAEKEYYLIAKEEMKYGEIVALSKPFVSLDPKRDSYERCHYCMVPCFDVPRYFSDKPITCAEDACMIVPEDDKAKLSPDSLRMVTPCACSECANVLYCSEACRTAAWTAYHRFECSQMSVLAKIDTESHLALRMLYMHGSFEENSPNVQMINGWESITDYGALMIDQQAYSFVYSNPRGKTGNLQQSLELNLTIGFLLKLVQMSDLFIRGKNIYDIVGTRKYIDQAGKACLLFFIHFYQGNVNETVPFTESSTNRTDASTPISVDGMKSMLKHSCDATVATSSLLTESFESNVKLLHATGAIPAGTELTLGYEIEVHQYTVEQLSNRRAKLEHRFALNCDCSRCVRETRDCLDISRGIYYPIACSLCGELMVRAGRSYRCSSTNGCTFKYSAQQMKKVYERVGKMMQVKRNAHLGTDSTYRSLQPKVYQLKAAIESTAQLLYGRSTFLAYLYARLAQCYLLISIAPISECPSGSIVPRIPIGTHTVHHGNLTTALLYTNKALDILEHLKQGPGIRTPLADQFVDLLKLLDKFKLSIFEQLLLELKASIGQVRGRCEAFLAMTAFDTMLASSLMPIAKE